MPSNNHWLTPAGRRFDAGFASAGKRDQLMQVRELICSAVVLIESSVGDAETLAHLRDALAEPDAELARQRD